MGAFNWIKVKATCPNCNKDAELMCQTHAASSFDGDETGRFCDHIYEIGDTMRWFDKADPRYMEWKSNGFTGTLPEDTDMECCYTDCPLCNDECFVVIEFRNCKIISAGAIGKLSHWPNDFLK